MIINDEWEIEGDKMRGRGKLAYYGIAATRLTEIAGAGASMKVYDWPPHMAAKQNFDLDLFVEAYRFALDHFAGVYTPVVDGDKLEASIRYAREVKAWVTKKSA